MALFYVQQKLDRIKDLSYNPPQVFLTKVRDDKMNKVNPRKTFAIISH